MQVASGVSFKGSDTGVGFSVWAWVTVVAGRSAAAWGGGVFWVFPSSFLPLCPPVPAAVISHCRVLTGSRLQEDASGAVAAPVWWPPICENVHRGVNLPEVAVEVYF